MRLGLLGMWHTHAHGIVRQIAAHPGEFVLAGCHDPDQRLAAERLAAWRPLLPVLNVFVTPAELLEQNLDGVVVEGQVWDNPRLARLALEAGLPVLMEKPAGTDLAELKALLKLAGERGLHLQMSYLFRYMSAVAEMLRCARRGDLGHIYEFHGRLPKDLALYAEHREELDRYAGGIFFEMAGHLIDMATAMFGSPQEVVGRLAHHHDSPGAFVDHGLAVLRYARAFATIQVSTLEAAPGMRRIEVYGTQGAIVIPHLGSGHLKNHEVQPLEIWSAATGRWERHDLPAAVLQITDLREFAAVVAGEKAPDYSPEHDLTVQQVLLEASAATMQPRLPGTSATPNH